MNGGFDCGATVMVAALLRHGPARRECPDSGGDMNALRPKIALKGQHAKPKHVVLRPQAPRPRRQCTAAGIVDTSGRWQVRLEDY
jgi:hypothetical protein